jgi:hypothetical protein
MSVPIGTSSAVPPEKVVVRPPQQTFSRQTCPRQIWHLLSPTQQEQIVRSLVLVCYNLIKRHDISENEVNDEQR